MAAFDFCPNSQVPQTSPREGAQVITLNGWAFTSKPTTPMVRTITLTLHGLHWILDANDEYDETITPQVNARALELFYEDHEMWKPFDWMHPHTGVTQQYRFASTVVVPPGISGGSGLISPLEVQLIEHNPGYSS